MDATRKRNVGNIPNREELLNRLVEVNNDSHLVADFSPHLLKYAGSQKNGMGVVMAFELALADFLQGYPPIIGNALRVDMDRYIDALMPNELVAADAKAFRAEVVRRLSEDAVS